MSLCIRRDTTCIRICWVGPSWVSLWQALIQINIFFPVCSLLQNPTKWPFNILTICCALFQWRSSLPLASRCQEEICPKPTKACSSTCTGEMVPAFRARSTRWTVFAVPWRCGTDAFSHRSHGSRQLLAHFFFDDVLHFIHSCTLWT